MGAKKILGSFDPKFKRRRLFANFFGLYKIFLGGGEVINVKRQWPFFCIKIVSQRREKAEEPPIFTPIIWKRKRWAVGGEREKKKTHVVAFVSYVCRDPFVEVLFLHCSCYFADA